jgi:hypothetical protein
MSNKPETPRVGFGYYEGDKFRLGLGYLVRLQNGQRWCYPGPEDYLGEEPHTAGAFPLDLGWLEEHAVAGSETPIYPYQSPIPRLPKAWGKPHVSESKPRRCTPIIAPH